MGKKEIGIFMSAIVLVITVVGSHHLQNHREMEVHSTSTRTSKNYHEERITVVANKLWIPDMKACAKEVVQKCRENRFKNVMFSYDYSIPNALYVTIYLSREDVKRGKEAFSFGYEQEDGAQGEYNIVEDAERFWVRMEVGQ